MRPIRRSQLTTKKIAWAATSPQRQQTGSMSRVIQFSPRSKQHDATTLVLSARRSLQRTPAPRAKHRGALRHYFFKIYPGGSNPCAASDFRKTVQQNFVMKGDFVMKRYLFAIIAGVGVVATSWFVLNIDTRPIAIAAQAQQSAVVFNADGTMQLPTGFRNWVFVGAPLTPNALNNGKANFPE